MINSFGKTGSSNCDVGILGILVKRSSCLFSTKERLRKVGQVLDKVLSIAFSIFNVAFRTKSHSILMHCVALVRANGPISLISDSLLGISLYTISAHR